MTMQLDLDSAVREGEDARLRIAIASLGSPAAFALLAGVHRSQPTRWLNHQGRPSAATQRLVDDVALVATKFVRVWPAEIFQDWLDGSNSFLAGASPKECLRAGRASDVLAALEGELAGVYA
ncbi:hypothetical protein [Agrococcus sp. KRD186]|uniref:hypothetical protein n=1 Tax=Agrococcus sp. KRD186 TaxID=2729730 RepID=UPI0019D109F1|nr:hypothetical protein [Agrococcus sp. KRD186]